jgi:alpha-tubulin suppressor-like RCC1 family protein
MATGFKLPQTGGYSVDLDDLLMRREYLSDGTLSLWGYNNIGQLGDSSIADKSSPVTPSINANNWRSVACGFDFTAAIKTDGTLWTWGSNEFGQLGDGTVGTSKSSPGTTAGNFTTWKSVGCGQSHTAAVKSDGTLWTWGRGTYGSLGDGTSVTKSSPVTTAGGGENWSSVVCGDLHTIALKTDGSLWTWGRNFSGQLGNNATVDTSSPATTTGGGTWRMIAAGVSISAGIKTDGTLWTWGSNGYGQLGDNSTTIRSTPTPISGGGNNWKNIAVGLYGSSAVKTDGTLWTWGLGTYGRLGDGSFGTSRSSPGTTVGGGTDWKQTAECGHACAAIKTNGTLLTWGYNQFGQLGDSSATTNSKNSPVTISGGGTSWKSVEASDRHIAAIVDISF